MIILIPIGHDVSVRRFPWVTATVMAVCVLLQIYSTVYAPPAEELARLEQVRERVAHGGPPDLPAECRDDSFTETCAAALARIQLRDPKDPAVLSELRRIDEQKSRLEARDLTVRLGFRPSDGLSPRMVLSAFVHGGWFHLLGNLLFLWLVGCNMEDRWGRSMFAGLFLLGAVAASAGFWAVHPGSTTVLVGASGAISAAMGAFLVCLRTARIRFAYFYWWVMPRFGTFEVSALWALPLWFVEQILYACIESFGYSTGVAYSAHVGGGLFGFAVALALRRTGVEQRTLMPRLAKGVEWEHDADLVAALDHLAKGRIDQARDGLQAVWRKDPALTDAREHLLRIGLRSEDVALVAEHADVVLAIWSRRHATAELVDTFRTIEHKMPDVTLSDRSLFDALKAASATDDAELAVRAARRMGKAHPESAFLPRALWEVAVLQQKHGSADLARKTLEQIAARWPLDPVGEQARRKLVAG